MWGTWNTTWFREVPPLLFWERGAFHHRPQTSSGYVQKGHGHTVAAYTAHTTKNSSIWGPIIYKPGPEIFIADWLLRNNRVEGKNKPIKDMDIWVDTIQNSIDMPECISMAEMQQASSQNDHLQQLKKFIIAGWPNTKDELHGWHKTVLAIHRWTSGNRWHNT